MRRVLAILALLVLVAYLATGIAQVRPGERAVVRRFGRVVAQPSPGLWVGLPWGMDRVDRVPVNFVRRLNVGFQPEADDFAAVPTGQMLTGDQNVVNVQVAIDYSVADGDEVVNFVVNRDRIEPAVTRATESALHEWVAAHTVDEVLLTGKIALRGWLARQVQERIADYGLGVRVQAASVVYLAAPEDVRPDFEMVMIAQSRISTQMNEARQHAEQLQKAAEGEASAKRQSAEAYAEGRRRAAIAEADAFTGRLEQYRRLQAENADVLGAIWWSEMGRLLASMKNNGQVDILDDRLGADGLDITQFARPKKKKE